MRNIFKKALAGTMSVALVASLFVGADVNKTTVKAEDGQLSSWQVYQSGTAPHAWGDYEESAYNSITFTDSANTTVTNFNSATTNANGEVVGGITDSGVVANGFAANIKSNGWQADYGNGLNNPWSLRMTMDNIKLTEGHIYNISFKAKATSTKYFNLAFNTGSGDYMFGETEAELGTDEKTFTYTEFKSQATTSLQMVISLGAFPVVNENVKAKEANWTGTVTFSDITFEDLGVDPDYEKAPEIPTEKPTVKPTEKPTVKPNEKPTVKPTVKPTTKPTVKTLAKVKGLKAVNKKKGTVKLSWKKVSKAKKYQIKVGSKTYSAKKNTLTVKKLKKGKKYTFKVRAIASGYKSSAWVKKSIKIKK